MPHHRAPTAPARRRRAPVPIAAAVAASAVAGCAATSTPPAAPTATSAATVTVTSAPAATPTTPAAGAGTSAGSTPGGSTPAGDGEPITLAFAGDVHFAAQLASLTGHPATALGALRPYLAAADISMVNLETSITTRGTAAPKTYTFRASPAALRTLAAAGVDVVTMANNHAVDYGRVGLTDTLAAQRAGPIPIVGLGPDASHAYAPHIITVRGRRVAFIGASQIGDWTMAHWTATETRPGIASAVPRSRLTAAVRAARRRADVVVVYLHWGTEGLTCPNTAQRGLAQALSDAGADIVVGTHAHRVQGAGWLGPTYVDYGLGNFVWYSHASAGGTTTGVLTLRVQGRRVSAATWAPLRVRADGIPRREGSAARTRMAASWQHARGCTGLAAQPPAGG